jgi:hypothetical protein
MSTAQSYLVPSVLLILSWVGYFLRLDPATRRALLGAVRREETAPP